MDFLFLDDKMRTAGEISSSILCDIKYEKMLSPQYKTILGCLIELWIMRIQFVLFFDRVSCELQSGANLKSPEGLKYYQQNEVKQLWLEIDCVKHTSDSLARSVIAWVTAGLHVA